MTWNLWWRFGPWRERQPAIAAELARADPDLALLQEVWCHPEDGDQADLLAAPRGYHVARSTKGLPGGVAEEPYRFGNAILSRWPVRSGETVVLPGVDEERSHRTAVVAEIDHPDGAFLAVSAHLEWRYDQSATRQRQLDALLEHLRTRRDALGSARPIIFGGDLNAVPHSDEVRRLTGLAPPYGGANHAHQGSGPVFTDCWAAVCDDPGYTWTRDNPYAQDALWPRRRIDYVLVSWPRPKPTDNPLTASLAGQLVFEGVVASDHYAVVVELDDRPPQETDE